MDEKKTMFEPQASCFFPILGEKSRDFSDSRVAFFCLHFFGETKKVSSCRSTTGQQSQKS